MITSDDYNGTRQLTDKFLIDGKNMIAPDEEPEFSYEDIDAADTGRDESGHMHRKMVIYKCGKWSFNYTTLHTVDYQYMESLFTQKTSFDFTRPSRTHPNQLKTSKCYRSKYKIVWKNSRLGIWKNYSFNIIEM